MRGEIDDDFEKNTTSRQPTSPKGLTLEKAVELGEYHPDFLATFPEWQQFSRIIQWEYIRRALKNRRHQLLVHWAEINNQIDFSKKPHLQQALDNLQKQLAIVMTDEEKYQVEYTI